MSPIFIEVVNNGQGEMIYRAYHRDWSVYAELRKPQREATPASFSVTAERLGALLLRKVQAMEARKQ